MLRKKIYGRALALIATAALAITSATGAAAAATKDIGFEKAVAAAKAEVDGLVTQAELDYSGRKLVYEIEILDKDNVEHDLDIDAADGDVLTHHKSNRAVSRAKQLRTATVSAEKAVAAVKKESGADRLISYELDLERNKPYWEINMTNGDGMEYEAVVDAKTGKVAYIESEYDD